MAEMNIGQRQAVTCEDSKILCLAGAGSGKTFSMIERISRLVTEEGVDPTSILVMTFTNAAALEMKTRFQKKVQNSGIPEFRTFHSFCYSLLSSDRAVANSLGYSCVPNIADVNQMKELEKKAKLQCGTKLSDKKLHGKQTLSKSEQFQLDVFQKALDRLLRKSGMITFDILCYDVCKLFVENAPIIQKYKDKYKYIFVDEFQDTDPKQWDFICAFQDAQVFVVGDALQAIYAFRGADSSIIKSLAEDDSWTTIRLYQNYRSTKEICEYANMNSTYAGDSYRIALEATREGEAVEEIPISTCHSHIDVVPSACLEDIGKRLVLSNNTTSSAILARTNAEVSYICKYLDSMHIRFRCNAPNTESIQILKSSIDESYAISWLATLLEPDKYASFIKLSEIEVTTEKAHDMFVEEFSEDPRIHSKWDSIVKIRSILDSDEFPFLKCSNILNILSIKNIVVNTSATTAREIIDYLTTSIESSAESSVYVGTIHSVKGLEYDSVYLVNVGGASFPLTSEENNNLFYVGITRAKHHLTVYRCTT